MKCAALVSLLLVAGCTPNVSLTPKVFISNEFTLAEMIEIQHGLDAWETEVKEVHFDRRISEHDALFMASNTILGSDDTIQIFGKTCPHGDIDPGLLGITHNLPGLAVICLDTAPLDKYKFLRLATEHEVGHAFGLKHRTGHTVMTVDLITDATGPTCEDHNDLAEIHDIARVPCEGP